METKDLGDMLTGALIDSSMLYGLNVFVDDASGLVQGTDHSGNNYFFLKKKEDEMTLNEIFRSNTIGNIKYNTVALAGSVPIGNVFWRKNMFRIEKECFMKAVAPGPKMGEPSVEGLLIRRLEKQEALAIAARVLTAEKGYGFVYEYLVKKYAKESASVQMKVAMKGDLSIGMMIQTKAGDNIRIDYLLTHPDFLGKGIARRLVGHTLEEAFEKKQSVFIKVRSVYKSRLHEMGFEDWEEIEYFNFRCIRPVEVKELPKHVPYNGVLRSKRECQECVERLDQLDLPLHPDTPKNWDTYAALDIILRHSGNDRKDKMILDAGGEEYSAILFQLEACGFKNLKCINLSMTGTEGVNHISYEYGDITATKFQEGLFDFVLCLSVIEHGVDLLSYLKEMHRILKKGGLLITSTDYWMTPVDTGDKSAYNAKMKVFTAEDVTRIADTARELGFGLKGDLDLECDEKTVDWLGTEYTFIYFTLEKLD